MAVSDELQTTVEARWPGAPLRVVEAHLRLRQASHPTHELDLAWAALVLAEHPAAVADFESLVKAEVRRAVSPINSAPHFLADVTQKVCERVLLPREDAPPRLADFGGEGPLAAWLRAVATRVALNVRPSPAGEVLVSTAPDVAIPADPEFHLVRRQYRQQFERAFTQALKSLSARERTLLRLTTLDGLTLAQVGPMYGKDASTISRWLAAARQTLHEQTRASLASSLSPSELDSVLRVADSELDLSLSRLLQSSGAP